MSESHSDSTKAPEGIFGKWRLIGDDRSDRTWPGTLFVHDRAAYVELQPPDDESKARLLERLSSIGAGAISLFGEAFGGRYSLLNCRFVGPRIHWSRGGEGLATFLVRGWPLVKGGFLRSIDEQCIHALDLSPKHFRQWLCRNSFEVERPNSDEILIYSVHCHGPTREEVPLGEGLSIMVRTDPPFPPSAGKNMILLEEKATLTLWSDEPLSLRSYWQLVRLVEGFFSVATLRYSEADQMTITFTEEGDQQRASIDKPGMPWVQDHHEDAAPGWFLFHEGDCKGDIALPLRAWFSKRDKLLPVINLYLAGKHLSPNLEPRFLSLCQAAEGYHRRFRKGRFLEDDQEFEERVYVPMKACIPNDLPTGLKQAMESRLKFGNERSLRARLLELLRTFEDALGKYSPDNLQATAGQIVEDRNRMVHVSEDDRPFVAADFRRLEAEATLLERLIEVSLLSEMDFTVNRIRELVLECWTYRRRLSVDL